MHVYLFISLKYTNILNVCVGNGKVGILCGVFVIEYMQVESFVFYSANDPERKNISENSKVFQGFEALRASATDKTFTCSFYKIFEKPR